jgi:hypothetical protein
MSLSGITLYHSRICGAARAMFGREDGPESRWHRMGCLLFMLVFTLYDNC